VNAFDAQALETAPDIGTRWRSDYITGVIRQDGGFIVLIDIAKVLTSQDAAMIAAPHTMGEAA
jgi:purine-binding chemotaxis protein CheW